MKNDTNLIQEFLKLYNVIFEENKIYNKKKEGSS